LSLKIIFITLMLYVMYVGIAPFAAGYMAIKKCRDELRRLWSGFYDGVLDATKKKRV